MENILGRMTAERKAEIHALAEMAYKKGFEDGRASVNAAETETIEHEGKYLRKVDRKARKGDYVRFSGLKSNYTMNEKFYLMNDDKTYTSDGGSSYKAYNWINCPNPEVFEVVGFIDYPAPEPLTANHLRSALIQKAKDFVENMKTVRGCITGRKGYSALNDLGIIVDADFIVNTDKRTVVCLLREQLGTRLVDKGIAKCVTGDVFNADIGKAIALAKALKVDIPQEFLKAVQPTVAPGQVFKVNESVSKKDVRGRVAEITTLLPTYNHLRFGTAFNHTLDSGWFGERQVTIIDDTNAEYEV